MAKNQVSEAEKKVAAAEKKKDKKPANPNGNWFQRAGKAIKKFFKDVKGEVKKIVWPDGKTVFKSTLVVLAVVAICGVAIFGVGQLLSFLLSLLKKAAQAVAEKGASDTEATTTAAIFAFKSFFLG